MPDALTLIPVTGLPRVSKGARLADLIAQACAAQDESLQKGDVLIVAQKIVSKAEGRVVNLRQVKPSAFAREYAASHDKDPRLVEVVLQETARVSRMARGVLIAETHHGFTCANAGVDRSNIDRDGQALLLPKDPDASAARLRDALERTTGTRLAVIISDTWGRPLRAGLIEFAIGVSGISPIDDYSGKQDYYGRALEHTAVAVADELAAAAGLLMRKEAGIPVVIARGYRFRRNTRATARSLLRKPHEDLFR